MAYSAGVQAIITWPYFCLVVRVWGCLKILFFRYPLQGQQLLATRGKLSFLLISHDQCIFVLANSLGGC
jgi:hypothetical protein